MNQFDKKATGELLGALVRGFFFGDDAVTGAPNQPGAQHQAPTQPDEPVMNIHPPMNVKPGAPKVINVEPPPMPKGIEVAQTTYQVLKNRQPQFFGEIPRMDNLQKAFTSYNGAALSLSDSLLFLATVRALMIRCFGVPIETVDYTLDAALEVVDELCESDPLQG